MKLTLTEAELIAFRPERTVNNTTYRILNASLSFQ